MDLHPVSRRINSPKNDDAECVVRAERGQEACTHAVITIPALIVVML